MAYQDFNAFKLFVLDVGLLAAMSELDIKAIIEGNRIFAEFKGALTEQYVLQQLIASREITPFYWSAEKSTAEIDFIFQSGTDIVPIEVKAAENLQAKSLKNYYQKYQPKHTVRSSMSDYRREAWLTNIPLYAINILINVIRGE
jgi:predicted AAA+ superfamily ATPase